jgi:hypothetical protein
MSVCWTETDFKDGDVKWVETYKQEDMLQVRYPGCLWLDMGWYGNRIYRTVVILNYDWGHPVFSFETTDEEAMAQNLVEAVDFIQNMPQYQNALNKVNRRF